MGHLKTHPYPSQEGSTPADALGQFPFWEGPGVGRQHSEEST